MLEYRVQYYKLVEDPSKGFVLEHEKERHVIGANKGEIADQLVVLQDEFLSVFNPGLKRPIIEIENTIARTITVTDTINQEMVKMVITKVNTVNLDEGK